MDDTIAILIAAGEATRWNNYTGCPKHLVKINNEPLLNRSVRLIKTKGINKIYVVSKEDSRYLMQDAIQYIAKLDKNNEDADKFLSSKELWNKSGRTIVFYGDVFFTEEAIDTIIDYSVRDWTLFCRPKKSELTGTPWGECFAQSFYPEHISKHEQTLYKIAQLKKEKKIIRCGGWEHYRAYVGIPDDQLDKFVMTTNYVSIDDFTDDFDFPDDYERFVKHYH